MTDLLIADFHIRQLQAHLVDSVWRRDIDAFVACFALDAEWKIAGQHVHGRDAIRSLIGKLLAPSARVLMLAGQPVLAVENGVVLGRSYITEYIKMTDGSAVRTIGIYYDRYAAGNDRWLFQSRHWQLCYKGPVDCSGPFQDVPDFGPPPGRPPGA